MTFLGNGTATWPQWRGRLSIFRLTVVMLMHLLLLLTPMTHHRTEAVLCLALTYVSLQFGLVLGYHRLLSHRCFTTYAWFRRFCALLGTLSMQSGPITWVAIHRVHHRISEQELDPHTPRYGSLWAHFAWTFFEHPTLSHSEERTALARDLYADPFMRFCEEKFIAVNAAGVAIVFLSGVAVGGLQRGFSFLVWLVAVRVVCLWHITFMTNSMGHMFGYRNYKTNDDSRNLWLIAILGLGDGWHNNHHAFPPCAAHGRRWFEVDVTYRLIRLFEFIGLAWDVRHPSAVPVVRDVEAGAAQHLV